MGATKQFRRSRPAERHGKVSVRKNVASSGGQKLVGELERVVAGLGGKGAFGARLSERLGEGESMKQAKYVSVGFWIATSLFALQMGFTAYAQLSLPEVTDAFDHLGFPGYFRIELSWLKLAGIAVLLAPAPARLKEWAYAGFAITLGSAVIAHLAVGDGAPKWSWAVGTAVLWGLSYFFFRKRESRGVAAPSERSAVRAFGASGQAA
jgi:DoxX-like family